MLLQRYIHLGNLQPFTAKNHFSRSYEGSDQQQPGYSLDSITVFSDNSPKPLIAADYRRQAYKLRTNIISHLYDSGIKHRTTFCGRALDQSGVILAKHNDRAFYANIAKCGNRWICPVCAAKIAATYKEQLHKYIEGARSAGDQLFFITLTIQHTKKHELRPLLDQLSDSWNKLNTGRYLQKLSYYITTEILYGKNGWHPHYHILLNTGQGNKSTNQIEADIQRFVLEKWTKINRGADLQAQNVKQCNSKSIVEYMTKGDLAYELTAQNVKNTAKGVHPWHLIGTDQEYLFAEYIEATKGKQINRKSRGFFEQYQVDDKSEVDALHEEEVITETLAIISTPVYNEIRRFGKLCDLLEAAEQPNTDILSTVATLLSRGVYLDYKSKSIHFDDQLPDYMPLNKSFLN